jgi:hypothetical protein
VNDANIKEGIFIEPQVRKLMQVRQLDEDLNETEKMHGCHSRGFAKTSFEISKQRTIRRL